jgi:formylmethanofuran dehydrogenase subunit E
MKQTTQKEMVEYTDCVSCGNYTTVLEQSLAVKTGKMLCEFCLGAN